LAVEAVAEQEDDEFLIQGVTAFVEPLSAAKGYLLAFSFLQISNPFQP